MRCRIACLFALLSMLLAAAGCTGAYAPADAAKLNAGLPLVIRNGTVIDGTGGDAIPNGMVIIQGERITAVGREADLFIPADAQIIDAEGGTILPGIIDSHVHTTWSPEIRRQFLEVGVTSVCDLGSPIEHMADFAKNRSKGQLVARGFYAGPIMTAMGGLPDAVFKANLNYEVGTPDEARRGVADLAGRGADVIKVYLESTSDKSYPMLGQAELKAIVDEAHARGLLVRAHVTNLDFVPMALDNDVDIIEHVPEPRANFGMLERAIVDSDDLAADLLDHYLVAEYDSLLPRIAEQGVIMVPTLARVVESRYGSREAEWQRILFDGLLEIIRRYHGAGGLIALGTDYNIGIENLEPDIFIREAQLLHAAGLTPVEVIEAATKNAARVCGQRQDLGTLEPGKLADILIVAGELTMDLESLSKVKIVILGGELAFVAEG